MYIQNEKQLQTHGFQVALINLKLIMRNSHGPMVSKLPLICQHAINLKLKNEKQP